MENNNHTNVYDEDIHINLNVHKQCPEQCYSPPNASRMER